MITPSPKERRSEQDNIFPGVNQDKLAAKVHGKTKYKKENEAPAKEKASSVPPSPPSLLSRIGANIMDRLSGAWKEMKLDFKDLADCGVDQTFIDMVAAFDDLPTQDGGNPTQSSPVEIHVHTAPPETDSDGNPPDPSQDPSQPVGVPTAPTPGQPVHPAILHAIGIAQQAAATALQHASNAMVSSQQAQQSQQQMGQQTPQGDESAQKESEGEEASDEDQDDEESSEQLPRLTTTPDRPSNVNLYPPQQQPTNMSDDRKRELMSSSAFGNSITWKDGWK